MWRDIVTLRRGFRITCIFKERLTALTRPRSNKAARTKNDFLKNASAAQTATCLPWTHYEGPVAQEAAGPQRTKAVSADITCTAWLSSLTKRMLMYTRAGLKLES